MNKVERLFLIEMNLKEDYSSLVTLHDIQRIVLYEKSIITNGCSFSFHVSENSRQYQRSGNHEKELVRVYYHSRFTDADLTFPA